MHNGTDPLVGECNHVGQYMRNGSNGKRFCCGCSKEINERQFYAILQKNLLSCTDDLNEVNLV